MGDTAKLQSAASGKLKSNADGKLLRSNEGGGCCCCSCQYCDTTPATWTISFSGINVSCAPNCQTDTMFHVSQQVDLGTFDPNDTFALAHFSNSSDCCLWGCEVTTDGTATAINGEHCAGIHHTSTFLKVQITLARTATGWSVLMEAVSDVLTSTIFEDVITDSGSDCTHELDFTNDNTPGASPGNCCVPPLSGLCIGTGGIGVATTP